MRGTGSVMAEVRQPKQPTEQLSPADEAPPEAIVDIVLDFTQQKEPPVYESDAKGGGQTFVPSWASESSLTSTTSYLFGLSSSVKMELRAVVTISLSVFGTGMLSLPKGIAAFETDRIHRIQISAVLCVLVTFFAASSFHLLGHVSLRKQVSTYVDVWNDTIRRAQWIVLTALSFEQYLTECIACGMVLADSCTSLAAPLKPKLPQAAQWLISRAGVLLVVSVASYPIVLQKRLKQLAKLSILYTVCFALVVVVVLKRYFDGSYAPGGQYWEFQQRALEAAGRFEGGKFPLLQVMILVSMLTNVLSVHVAAPAVYHKLSLGRSEHWQTAPSEEHDTRPIATAVAGGFAGGGAATMGSMTAGYLLFGVASKGNLLENFHPDDPLGIIAKILVACGVFTVFPLRCKPIRDYVYRIFGLSYRRRWLCRGFTALELIAIMVPAVVLEDLGFLQAMSGATSGILVTYVCPALMVRYHARSSAFLLALWAALCMVTGVAAVLFEYA